jgi:G:T-mismatch repair DNA endonuclease (very short patch repair protein)
LTRGFNKISKISNALFQNIEKEINEKCYYGKEEQTIQFYEGEKYSCFYVDFKINNKIIEFYGDYWHGNPILYKYDDIVGGIYKHSKVEDIWKRDKERIEKIKGNGYDILIIWEYDYKKNKEDIKNKCIKWIKNS